MLLKNKSDYIEYNLTEQDYYLLVDAASGHRNHLWKRDGTILAGKAERVRYAWELLGSKYGFYYQSVLPISEAKILAIPFKKIVTDENDLDDLGFKRSGN